MRVILALSAGVLLSTAGGLVALARLSPPDPGPHHAVEEALMLECRDVRTHNWSLRCQLADLAAENRRLAAERDAARRAAVAGPAPLPGPGPGVDVPAADRIPPQNLPVPAPTPPTR